MIYDQNLDIAILGLLWGVCALVGCWVAFCGYVDRRAAKSRLWESAYTPAFDFATDEPLLEVPSTDRLHTPAQQAADAPSHPSAPWLDDPRLPPDDPESLGEKDQKLYGWAHLNRYDGMSNIQRRALAERQRAYEACMTALQDARAALAAAHVPKPIVARDPLLEMG